MALPNWIKNNTWQWIIGTIIAIAAITVPLTINQKSQKNVVSVGDGTISDSEIHVGDKIYNKGITKEEFESNLHNFEQRIIDEIRKTEPSQTRHRELEIELEIVREKLSNLQQSFEEETKRRKEAVTALEKLEGALPEAKIKEARKNLQSGGDAKIAEELFDEVDEEGAVLVALAAYQSGQLAEGRIDYAKAMKKYRRAVALENSNPDYLLAAGTMARTLGDYKEAQPWLEKLLQLRQKETTETVELALVQNELANLYSQQGKYEEAEPLYKRDLEITEKALGADHPSVATTLNNLALLYKAQGKYEEAEPLYKRSLGIYEKVLGADHPSVATTLGNLAELYSQQGKYEEAEPLYKRSLGITEKALGADHPSVATTLNNLANLYRQQGKYEEAEPLYKRDLEITEKSLGPDHPSVATTLNNLAGLYEDMGKYEEAEPLYKRSLEIKEKSLGPDHPSVAATLNNLAGLYRQQGKYEEAEPLYKRSLGILQRTFPNGHPNIDVCESNYASMKEEWQSSQ